MEIPRDIIIPFQITIKLPPPRYYPEILKRDNKGRIVTIKFPPVVYKQKIDKKPDEIEYYLFQQSVNSLLS